MYPSWCYAKKAHWQATLPTAYMATVKKKKKCDIQTSNFQEPALPLKYTYSMLYKF